MGRFTKTEWQHVMVASLIGHCEAVISSGCLSEPVEESMRILVAETLSAFGMQPHQREQEAIKELRA